MSESVNKVSASAFNDVKADKVTELSKKKLKELGIDPSTVKTETEAQNKIKEAESAQANAQIQQPQNIHFNHPMGEVIKDAKELAEKIGIKVHEIDDIKKFLETIDKTIKDFEKQVENDKDDERRNMVSGVRNVYKEIKAEYDRSIAEQKKVTSNLDAIAAYNMVRS